VRECLKTGRVAWVGALGLATVACSPTASAPAHAAPGQATAPSWSYEVEADSGAHELSIVATFTGETDPELTVEEGGEPFVRDVEVTGGKGSLRLEEKRGSWFLREPCRPTCTVHYRYRLLDAARASGEVSVARLVQDSIEAPPSTWLLRPARAVSETPFRFHVTTAPGDAFVSGVFPSPNAAATYEGKTDQHYQLAYAAFGHLRVRELRAGRVELALLPGSSVADDAIAAWVDSSAAAVASFYGDGPTRRLLVLARPMGGNSVGFGTTMGHSGAAISIDVGVRSSPAELRSDWVLVHEMVHTALPDLEGPQHWLEEGLATYVEPLVRRRAGILTSQDVWAEWVAQMPNGEPEAGDQGLDATPTWGRTYWGGALFCLAADVEIRRRTHNAHSLPDALRAILAAGGSIAQSWSVERVLEVGDAATGVAVLREQYARMAHAPSPVDLPGLWKSLGISAHGRTVTFDDTAPLAAVRRGITGDDPAAPAP
jgi:hypothetical protein